MLRFLRFTSSLVPVKLLKARMAAEPLSADNLVTCRIKFTQSFMKVH